MTRGSVALLAGIAAFVVRGAPAQAETADPHLRDGRRDAAGDGRLQRAVTHVPARGLLSLSVRQ
jgi:hypothetical protein